MKKFIISFLFLSSLAFPLLGLSLANAQFNPLQESCDNIPNTDQQGDSQLCNDSNQDTNPVTGTDGVLLRVADVLAIVAAVIAVIVIVVAGITMMTSGGDSTKVQNSRNAIIYAAVGLVVIVLARSIVIFVINQTG